MLLNLLIALFCIFLIASFASMVVFSREVERNKDVFESLGKPSIFDANGQAKFLALVIGVKRIQGPSAPYIKKLFMARLFSAAFILAAIAMTFADYFG